MVTRLASLSWVRLAVSTWWSRVAVAMIPHQWMMCGEPSTPRRTDLRHLFEPSHRIDQPAIDQHVNQRLEDACRRSGRGMERRVVATASVVIVSRACRSWLRGGLVVIEQLLGHTTVTRSSCQSAARRHS